MGHSSMFDFLYDTYKIKNKIKLIECFAGYGSQNLALKYLGANYEHHRIVEWATKSIQAYNDIHIQDYTDYSQFSTFNEVVNYLIKKGISMDYKKPMTLDQIKRKGEKWCRNVYNNIIATRNLVNIMNVKAQDLDITNKEYYTYLLTYSYPCQSLSLAGKREGMKKGSGTESSMLWEIERILRECYELSCLPQVLVMENVIGCCDQKNINDFQEWVTFLESLGYKNYFKIMNAKDFLIPQNRERVFMVSILGDYNYNFANEVELKLRLKDLLEDIVDEKYYLSQQMVDGMQKTNFESYKLENKLLDKNGIANCIIARYEGAPQCIEDNNSIINLKRGYSCEVAKEKEYFNGIDYIGNYSKSNFNQTSIVGKNGLAPTVTENHGQVTAIVEDTPKLIICIKLIIYELESYRQKNVFA